MKRSLTIINLLLVILLLAAYFLRSQFFSIAPEIDLLDLSNRELRINAIEALKEGDEPISALLLYDYSIIGRGHNTVQSDTNVVGHAIINAINDAVKKFGLDQFRVMNKNSLRIMTTSEPCQVCKAVMIEYGITKVEFMQKLPLNYWLNVYWEDFSFDFGKRRLYPNSLQDSLYELKQTKPNKFLP
jgi:tRNA(Arg) A34 adenosine deaminase TadA